MKKINRVFIFAHCDDELFCLPLLLDNTSNNSIIFLTTETMSDRVAGKIDERRSEAILANSYINKFQPLQTHFFPGNIFDGSVHIDFSRNDLHELIEFVVALSPDELVTLSYEGGHQDHDTVELITRLIGRSLSSKVRSFSAYRASPISRKLFHVSSPRNPNLEKIHFDRIKVFKVTFKLILIYKSQIKTWIGLGPSLLIKYLCRSYQETSLSSGVGLQNFEFCFYEGRNRALQSEVLVKQGELLNF